MRTYQHLQMASETPLLNELRDAPVNASPDNPRGQLLLDGSRLRVHHLRRLREFPVPGLASSICPSSSACSQRRGQHRSLARHLRYPNCFGPRKARATLARPQCYGERDKFIAKQAFPIFDGSQELLPLSRLHGRLRPQGPRDHRRLRARHDSTSAPSFGVMKKRKMHRRPRAATRQRPRLRFTRRARPSPAFEKAQVKQDRGDMPALRAHHRHRLARVRHRSRNRTPLRVHGTPRRPTPQTKRWREHRLSRPLLSRPLSGCLRRATGGSRGGRHARRSSPPRRTELLLRGGRRPRVPRRRNRSELPDGKPNRVSHNRAAELVATGAKTIGTACPFCNTMFRDALGAVGGEAPPQLLDIAQLTARALPQHDAEHG